jgi:hypothetical protein
VTCEPSKRPVIAVQAVTTDSTECMFRRQELSNIPCFLTSGNDSDPRNGLHPYRIAYTNTHGKPPWFGFVREEYEACREQVGLSDYSSFTKIDFWVCMVRGL